MPQQVIRAGRLRLLLVAALVTVTTAVSGVVPGRVDASGLAPQVAIDCGAPLVGNYSSVKWTYGYNLQFQTGPLWATIDYGDGKIYSTAGTDKVKTKVFWHTYRKPGTFHVKVTIYDVGAHTSASASCVATWTRPPSGGSTGSSSGGKSRSPSVPASGPTALCRDGTYSYSQHRSGTCSWHGGVAVWY